MNKELLKYLPHEVKVAIQLAGLKNIEVDGDNLKIITARVGIIPDVLNLNGYSGRWDLDVDVETQDIQWIIKNY